MTANELRIGNYIYLPDQITHEIKEGGELDAIKLHYGIDYYKGIPISEDWLLKFGFEETFWQKSGEFAHWNKDGISWFDKDIKCIIWYNKVNIEYVHQLQNLYFALTGKELTL